MTLDIDYQQLNRTTTNRLRSLVTRLTDVELQRPVGAHWTVAITLAHLAFWDRYVLYVLDETERNGQLSHLQVDIVVNDLALPLWAAIPPSEAVRLAIETAEMLDQRLEEYPAELLTAIYSQHQRWVIRAWHRNEHLDEIDAALKG